MRTPQRPHWAGDPEAGSVTAFTILIASLVLVMMGLAVDVAGHIHAMQEARSVAREAARAGGQEMDKARAVQGVDTVTNPYQAAAAANAYLAAAGVSGHASMVGPETVTVTVNSTYSTKFLGVVGIGSLSATGTAEARLTRSLEGVEQ